MKNKVIRLGVVGLDGHGPVFAKEVNSPGKDLGARVVAAMPVPSIMVTEEVLAKNVAETRNLDVEIVDEPEQLASRVDGVLILHDDGSKHLDLFRRFVDFGKPIFVDKPLEVTAAKARELADLCRVNQCPVFTASALRFCPEVQEVLGHCEDGSIISAMTYSPYLLHPAMPGWIYYAIHAIEQLYTLMGATCKEVRCFPSGSGAVAIGTWRDGRTGIAKAMSQGPHTYGFTVWSEKKVYTKMVNVDTIYSGLLSSIIDFVKTRSSPISMDESVEVIGFLEAANASMVQCGKAVKVKGCAVGE